MRQIDFVDEWYASLAETLEMNKVGFCLDSNFAHLFRPVAPEPQLGNSQQAQLAYRNEVIDYQNRVTEYRSKFMIAIGFLKNSLTFGSRVRAENDNILGNKPPQPIDDDGQPVEGWDWFPDDAFNAAIQFIRTNYAPSDATDVASFRQMISELTDNGEGGFNQCAE